MQISRLSLLWRYAGFFNGIFGACIVLLRHKNILEHNPEVFNWFSSLPKKWFLNWSLFNDAVIPTDTQISSESHRHNEIVNKDGCAVWIWGTTITRQTDAVPTQEVPR